MAKNFPFGITFFYKKKNVIVKNVYGTADLYGTLELFFFFLVKLPNILAF